MVLCGLNPANALFPFHSVLSLVAVDPENTNAVGGIRTMSRYGKKNLGVAEVLHDNNNSNDHNKLNVFMLFCIL